MYKAHPLYRVPRHYPGIQALFIDAPGRRMTDHDTGDLLVFSTTLHPYTPVADEVAHENGYFTLRDFAPPYTSSGVGV